MIGIIPGINVLDLAVVARAIKTNEDIGDADKPECVEQKFPVLGAISAAAALRPGRWMVISVSLERGECGADCPANSRRYDQSPIPALPTCVTALTASDPSIE